MVIMLVVVVWAYVFSNKELIAIGTDATANLEPKLFNKFLLSTGCSNVVGFKVAIS